MYIIIRTVEFEDKADRQKAMETAMQMADYLKHKQNLETKVALNVGGEVNQLHFVITSNSIDNAPAREAERMADAVWQKLLHTAIDDNLFKPGTTRDAIYRIVN